MDKRTKNQIRLLPAALRWILALMAVLILAAVIPLAIAQQPVAASAAPALDLYDLVPLEAAEPVPEPMKAGESRAASTGPGFPSSWSKSAELTEGSGSAADPHPSGLIGLAMADSYHSQVYETELPNACGPTSLLMVLDYWGIEASLASVIEKHLLPPEQGGYDPTCTANPVCTSPEVLASVAREYYGLQVVVSEGWTLEAIYAALSNGRLIIADITWRLLDGGPGHFVVIYGVDLERQEIIYHDPYDGASLVASWADFASSWNGPVDVGDPLQPEGHSAWGMVVYLE